MTDHEHLVLKFLQGKLSEDEKIAFKDWLNESSENQALVEEFQKVWSLTPDQSLPSDFNTDREYLRFKEVLSEKEGARIVSMEPKRFSWIAAACLVLLVAAGITLYFQFSSSGEIVKQTASIPEPLTLPDGSVILLNANSMITYNEDFKDLRGVRLRGEAFFEVKKDPEHPFTITTGNAKVTVLGTSFNVQSENDTLTEVLVVTGKVQLTGAENSSLILNPGSLALCSASKPAPKLKELSPNVLSWKEKRLVFEKMPLHEVLHDIRKYFGAEFSVKNKALLTCRFTGSFSEPTLDEVFESLAVALDLEISKHGDTYAIEGEGCK
jgi:ferric-dicitrate binding protein FerR (iron transport regulator)